MASALLRAAHVNLDPAPWVLHDTVSAQLVPADQAAPLETVMAAWPGVVHAAVRVRHAARTRVAEDVATEGLGMGRSDYVLLGAGLDSFAWRHSFADRFTVWEFDHPDTQEWKRDALARAALPVMPNVRFEPIDLTATDLARLPTPRRATWNWLGVTMYLPRAATAAALGAIASHQPGTTLIVDFNLTVDTRDELAAAVSAATGAALAGIDEPLTTTYTREEAASLLYAAGFAQVTVWDAAAVRARYFPRRDDLPDHRASLIAVAVV